MKVTACFDVGGNIIENTKKKEQMQQKLQSKVDNLLSIDATYITETDRRQAQLDDANTGWEEARRAYTAICSTIRSSYDSM